MATPAPATTPTATAPAPAPTRKSRRVASGLSCSPLVESVGSEPAGLLPSGISTSLALTGALAYYGNRQLPSAGCLIYAWAKRRCFDSQRGDNFNPPRFATA